MNLDKRKKELEYEAIVLQEVFNTAGWKLVKEKFEEQIEKLDTLRDIKEGDKIEKVLARKYAIEILRNWWQSLYEPREKLEELNKSVFKPASKSGTEE